MNLRGMLEKILLSWALTIVIALCLPAGVCANSIFSQFVDPQDGALDVSQWLGKQAGFLPVPILITEPAVGVGAGAALLFFHGKDKAPEGEDGKEEPAFSNSPPSVSLGFAAYTESDSWLAGGGHVGIWKDDHIRYTGILGLASLNLKFYGTNQDSNLNDNGVDFNIDGQFLLQEIKFRVKDSPFFIGTRYTYLNSESKFDLLNIPEVPPEQLDMASSGLGILFNYDTRDNIITPNKGHDAKFEYMNYSEALGGDSDYHRINTASLSYWPIFREVILGVRLDAAGTWGDTPFYDLPFIQLRGIPAMRYQNDLVLVGELEARWDITYRWSMVGFGGSGWAADSFGDLGSATARLAGGMGFRYLLAREMGMRAGIDIAKGPEDTVLYIQVGTAW